LTVGWFDVFSRAAVTVTACSDLVVERTVDLDNVSEVEQEEVQISLPCLVQFRKWKPGNSP